ncbi:MAG: YitT family protein [Bacteroidales bacterium]|nr:YitT family protein [Bacteroidales bacterium]
MDLKHQIRVFLVGNDPVIDWKLQARNWFYILLGCVCMSVGFTIFINPYNIVPGGVYGLSIVMHNIFPSIQVGYFGYMFDIPLLITSMLVLGSKFGGRTIVSVLLTPFLMNTIEKLSYPTEEALRALDPTQLLGGVINLSDHLMLTCIFGAVFIGLGCGLMVRGGATSGGTDVISMIMQKYLHIPFSTGILISDGTVVGFGLLVIGFGVGADAQAMSSPSWLLSFYSLISVYVTSRTVAYVINGSANDKIIFVISGKELPTLHDYILKDLDRTATVIKSHGLYTGADKEMLFLVVGSREVMKVKQQIRLADPAAFVVVTDAYDIYGEGFKPLPLEDDINPE